MATEDDQVVAALHEELVTAVTHSARLAWDRAPETDEDVDAGRLPIDDHQDGHALFRESRELRRRIDRKRRPDGQEQVTGHGLPLGQPHFGLGHGLLS